MERERNSLIWVYSLSFKIKIRGDRSELEIVSSGGQSPTSIMDTFIAKQTFTVCLLDHSVGWYK